MALSAAFASLTLQPRLRCGAASSSMRGCPLQVAMPARCGRGRVAVLSAHAEDAPEAPDAAEAASPAPRGKGKRGGPGDGPRGPRRGAPREKSEFEERVVQVSRVTKVVKGGKQLSFRAVVVVGNKNGKVGVGVAKAKEVIIAVQKAVVDAKKTLSNVPVTEVSSVPHKLTVIGNGSCRVMIRPALAGSGITAGGAVRAVLELAGYKNVNAKMLGASNPLNNGRAALDALRQMKMATEVAEMRGLSTEEVRGALCFPCFHTPQP
jgi:small subunit ribosomal protein S5